MGCGSGNVHVQEEIIEDIPIEQSEFVIEKKGNFTDDYILGDIIGKENPSEIIYKATNKFTNEIRAVRCLDLRKATPEDKEKLFKQIETYKKFVFFSSFILKRIIQIS